MKKLLFIIALGAMAMPSMYAKESQEAAAVEAIPRDSVMAVVERAKEGDLEAKNIVASWYYTGQNLTQNYKTAFGIWADAAKKGNTAAIGNLGMCYQTGNGVEPDSVMAFNLYVKSMRQGNQSLFNAIHERADKGSAFDCNLIAYCYNKGIGTSTDYVQAAKYYGMLAKKGDLTATRDAGIAYLNAKDYKKALPFFEEGAKGGNTTCQYYYGKMLSEGLAGTTDAAMGFIYLQKSAEAGFANGQYALYQAYKDGNGTAASQPEARKWLRLAAYQGLPKAVFDYGCLTARESEFFEAAFMFSWLANRNSYTRQITEFMNGSDKEAGMMATPFGHYTLAQKHIAAGDLKAAMDEVKVLKKAKFPIADVLEAEIMINPAYEKSDIQKGLKNLAKLVDKYPYAAYVLGRLYERGGSGVGTDGKLAVKYFDIASGEDFPLAFDALGDFFYENLFDMRDIQRALNYYAEAYSTGLMLASSANRYAVCLREGNECSKNEELSEQIIDRKYPADIHQYLKLIK